MFCLTSQSQYCLLSSKLSCRISRQLNIKLSTSWLTCWSLSPCEVKMQVQGYWNSNPCLSNAVLCIMQLTTVGPQITAWAGSVDSVQRIHECWRVRLCLVGSKHPHAPFYNMLYFPHTCHHLQWNAEYGSHFVQLTNYALWLLKLTDSFFIMYLMGLSVQRGVMRFQK